MPHLRETAARGLRAAGRVASGKWEVGEREEFEQKDATSLRIKLRRSRRTQREERGVGQESRSSCSSSSQCRGNY